jgi:hypothetical protein
LFALFLAKQGSPDAPRVVFIQWEISEGIFLCVYRLSDVLFWNKAVSFGKLSALRYAPHCSRETNLRCAPEWFAEKFAAASFLKTDDPRCNYIHFIQKKIAVILRHWYSFSAHDFNTLNCSFSMRFSKLNQYTISFRTFQHE